jgi:hypothetical protein
MKLLLVNIIGYYNGMQDYFDHTIHVKSPDMVIVFTYYSFVTAVLRGWSRNWVRSRITFIISGA